MYEYCYKRISTKRRNAKNWNIDDLGEIFHMTDQTIDFLYTIIVFQYRYKLIFTLVQLISHLSIYVKKTNNRRKNFSIHRPRIN